MKIATEQVLPAAETLSSAVNALPVPVAADSVPQSGPSWASQLSYEQREQIISGFADGISAGPPGAAGEAMDTVDAFTHRPHGALSAAGYTVALALTAAVQRSGQLQERPVQEWLGRAGWTVTQLAGSLMRHDTDVAATTLTFFAVINDGIELHAKTRAERAEPEADPEAWLQTLVDAVRADPHALDPIIEASAQQMHA